MTSTLDQLCIDTRPNLLPARFSAGGKVGGRLHRTGTIASGAATCDFRWKPREPADSQSNGKNIITREAAVAEIARRYRQWTDIFELGQTAAGFSASASVTGLARPLKG